MAVLTRPLLSLLALALLGASVLAAPVKIFPPLPDRTEAGWNRYASLTEQRITAQLSDSKRFLVLDFGATSTADRQAVLAGHMPVSKMETRQADGSEVDVPEAWVHHWRGAVLIRGARLDSVLARLQEEIPGTGRGDVIASRILARDGTRLKTFIKLRRSGRLIVAYDFVYNTEHDVVLTRRTATTGVSTTVATKIAEMYHPGGADEREFGAGEDNRLLQRWNSYWRYEQVPAGVIAECESITLSRRGPFGFGRGFADGTAQESMEKALENLRAFFATPVRTRPALSPAR
jgi:hypothetical protein